MRTLTWALAPLLLVPALFFGALWLDGAPVPRASIPFQKFERERCTWACHNGGCLHRSVLPNVLVADDGVFGAAIDALYAFGSVLVDGDRGRGYGAANLVVFCAVWPGTMYALWLIAVVQRHHLRRRRRTA